ncbi:hypothetical protein ACA910_011283 [Epithemia clementina (nom. ined.)]
MHTLHPSTPIVFGELLVQHHHPADGVQRAQPETPPMANKKSSPEISSPWDLEAFEQQVQGDSNWSQSSAKKKPNRVQDLAFSLDTPPPSPRPTEKETSNTWPFESSPCRMFGAKNTRALDDADSKNENIFDTSFADRPVTKKVDVVTDTDEDEETSIEDEFESEDLLVDESDDESDSSCGDCDSVLKENDPSDNSALQQRQRTSVPIKDDKSRSPRVRTSSNVVASAKSSSSPQHVRNVARGKSASPGRAGSEKKNRLPKTRKDVANNAQNNIDNKAAQKVEKRQIQPRKIEKSKPATAGAEKSIRTDRTARKKADKPRNQSTNDEGVLPSSNHGSTRVRRGLSRAKSSDGMEGFNMGASSEHTWSRKENGKARDELSTGSYHTSASLGRHTRSQSVRRDGSTTRGGGTPKPSVVDRRSKFARAMSTSNVKRPEEYAHYEAKAENKISQFISERRKASKPSSSVSVGASVASRESDDGTGTEGETKISQFIAEKRKTSKPLSTTSVASRESTTGKGQAKTNTNNNTETTTVPETDESVAASSVDDSEQQQQQQQKSSSAKARPAMRRKRSARLGRSGSASNPPQPTKQSDSDAKSISSNTAMSSSSNQGRSSRRSSREKRDLMMLLRERKSIHPVDVMDKENRKLLHFLMYEHKMGISQQELQQRIRQDKESS